MTGEGYAVEFVDGEMVMSDRDELRERLAFSSEGGVFAGEWPRTMMESRNADDPLWVGTFETTYGKHRPVPIDPATLDTHMAIFGGTGKGKSTLVKNILVQLAMDGSGFCFIDPKSGGDVYELLRMLPDDRLDDVVWIDPSAHDRDRVTGLNFLEPRVETDDPDDPELRQEVEAITDDLKGVLKGGDFWGPRMNRVMQNIVRAMALSETDYTLLDMYYILNDEERREAFADAVEAEGFAVLAEYSRQIAEELDGSDLDALIGRLQPWVENSITREIVSHEQSSVNIAEAVREGKIILVKNDVQSETAKKAIATAITRRIWTAIQRRAQDTHPEERERFYLMVDEADDVLTEEMEVETMLTKARALDLSLGLISQYPSQLADSIQDAIFANVNTLLAMAVTEQRDARTIMSQFPDYDKTDLMNLDKYRAWTTIEVDNERRGPFVTETFADYPPRQTDAEAEAAIEQSLARYGVPRKTTGEMLEGLNIPSETTADHITEEEKLTDVARAIWISREATPNSEYVSLDRVRDVHEKLGAYGDYEFAELLEANPDLFERKRRDGDLHVGLTNSGEQLAQTQDSGSAGSGGKLDHRDLLTQSREALAGIGIALEIPEQGGDKDLADGIGHVFTTDHQDVIEALQAGRDIDTPLHIEVETSTLQTRPAQTLENLRQAMEAGRQCVFVVPEAEDDTEKWARKVEELLDAPYAMTDAEGNRRYYRSSTPLEAPRGIAVRPADGTTAYWWEDSDELVLEGQDGTEYIRYDSLTAMKNTDIHAFPAYLSEEDGQYVVAKGTDEVARYDTKEALTDDWTSIHEPFIAEERLPHPPRDEDYAVLIVPADETEPIQWYQQGDRIALSDLHSAHLSSEKAQSDAEEEDSDDDDGNIFASTDF